MTSPLITVIARRRSGTRLRHARGFTLVELVVVVILIGVLAAIAVPRYIALGRDARLAVVNTLASTIQSTVANVRVMCTLDTGCDYNNVDQFVTIAGQTAELGNGWLLTARGRPGELEAWIQYSGFTRSGPAAGWSRFSLDGSPDSDNCAVNYIDTQNTGPSGPAIGVSTSGC